jgi:hypothetical protein
MSYVVYHKDTTRFLRILKGRTWEDAKYFATEGAAKAALTRLEKKGAVIREDYLIAESGVFYSTIEKTETVTNLMSGKPIVQSVNTPLVCDPSSETYWSF